MCSDRWSSHHCNWARRAIWTPGVCDGCVGAVVIGNALHWMDEAATLQAGATLAVITQGPPM